MTGRSTGVSTDASSASVSASVSAFTTTSLDASNSYPCPVEYCLRCVGFGEAVRDTHCEFSPRSSTSPAPKSPKDSSSGCMTMTTICVPSGCTANMPVRHDRLISFSFAAAASARSRASRSSRSRRARLALGVSASRRSTAKAISTKTQISAPMRISRLSLSVSVWPESPAMHPRTCARGGTVGVGVTSAVGADGAVERVEPDQKRKFFFQSEMAGRTSRRRTFLPSRSASSHGQLLARPPGFSASHRSQPRSISSGVG